MCADTAVACQQEPRKSRSPRLGITDHSREPLPYFRGWEYQTVSCDMIAVLYRPRLLGMLVVMHSEIGMRKRSWVVLSM